MKFFLLSFIKCSPDEYLEGLSGKNWVWKCYKNFRAFFHVRSLNKVPFRGPKSKIVINIFVLKYFFRATCKISVQTGSGHFSIHFFHEILHAALKNYFKTKMYCDNFWFRAAKGYFALWLKVKKCLKIIVTLPNPIFYPKTC